jgi:hypothetical protein
LFVSDVGRDSRTDLAVIADLFNKRIGMTEG